MIYADEVRSMTCRREKEELEKAEVAQNRAQTAADRKAIAERKPILKELKQIGRAHV